MPVPHELDKMPAPSGGNVNAPSSGTYGEKAELQRLHQSLPSSGAAPAAPPPETPVSERPPLAPVPPPAGIPAAVLEGPSPGGAPPPTPAPVPAQPHTSPQRRLAILQALSESPDVSEVTREWAQMVLQALVGASRQT